jgi:hypothetical protein
MARSSEKSPVVPILLVCTVLAVGAVAYIKMAPADKVVREVQNEQQTGGERVHLLVPYYADHELKFTSEQFEVPRNVDPHVYVVNDYLRATRFVPKEATVKTCVIEDGTATLDFTEAFYTSYGTEDESTVVNGILNVMGQFNDVSFVRILVEGKPIDTLGNIELTDPLPVIRPEGLEPAGSAQQPPKS